MMTLLLTVLIHGQPDFKWEYYNVHPTTCVSSVGLQYRWRSMSHPVIKVVGVCTPNEKTPYNGYNKTYTITCVDKNGCSVVES
jgi:hypothetical protein